MVSKRFELNGKSNERISYWSYSDVVHPDIKSLQHLSWNCSTKFNLTRLRPSSRPWRSKIITIMLMIITIIIITINNNRGHVLCKFGRGGRIFKKTIDENIKYNFKKASLKRSILIFFLENIKGLDWSCGIRWCFPKSGGTVASHAGVFKGARHSSLPTNACSAEDNIPFPSLANQIVLSKFWKLSWPWPQGNW